MVHLQMDLGASPLAIGFNGCGLLTSRDRAYVILVEMDESGSWASG
jgi:hypothetical protein